MSNERIHVVIHGCGAIAKKHASVLRGFPKDSDVSFSSRDGDKAQRYRDRWRGLKAYGGLESALEDPAVDVVLLCTPHHTHAPLAEACLRAGKRVIVEKPLALTFGEGSRLVASAESKGLLLTVAENYHYRPGLLKLEEWIARGMVGDLQLIRIHKLHRRKADLVDWRVDAASMGGGALIDGGIHWVNVLNTLAGPVADVMAQSFPDLGAGRAEMGLSVLSKSERGVVGQLNYSWIHSDYSDLKFFAVYGTKGTVYVNHTFLFLHYHGRSGRRWWVGLRDALGFRAMWEDFLKSIRDGTSPRMTARKALEDVRFVEKAYRSMVSSV